METPNDTQTAFLFESADGLLHGAALEETGRLLPETSRWLLVGTFPLGVHQPGPGIPPEPIIRGILNVGFFVWARYPAQPHGTSQ